MPIIQPDSGSGFSLGAAADITGAVGSLGGAFAQSQALRAQASYQSKISDINFKLAQWQEGQALQRGNTNASLQIGKTNEIRAAQSAGFSASGIDANSGSAARVQARTTEVGGIDALTIANNATREAFGIQVGAINASAQGQFNSMAANNQATNSLISGGITSLAYGLKGADRVWGSPSLNNQQSSNGTFNFDGSDSYTLPNFGAQAQNSGEYSLLGGS